MAEQSQSFPPIGTSDSSWRSALRKCPVTIEPILLLVFFSMSIADGYSMNLLLSRTCTVIYNLPESKCKDIDQDVEELIQPYTTKITMLKSIIEAALSGVFVIFIGPWSDKNGRKPFLVYPLAGYTLYFIGWFILSKLPTAHPMWFLLPSVFYNIPGGLVSLFTCIFCYLTDITNERNRAFRMAIVSSTVSCGIVGGYLTSFYIIRSVSDASTMLLSLAIAGSFIALLYTVALLPESLTICAGTPFFNARSVRDVFRAVFEQRPKQGRARLLLAVIVLGISLIILLGEGSYRYYALRKSFSWTLEHYNIYSAIVCAISVLASAIGSYISTSVLRVHELYVALFAVLMSTLSSVLSALSRTSVEFYIFSVVGCFGSLVNPMLKTQITRNLSKNDLGKVFAFISTVEAFSPMLASSLYRTVYNNVLDHQPLAVLFVSAGFWAICSSIIIVILLIQAFCTRNYEELIINASSEEGIAQPIEEAITNDIS